jgi:hypothetical protein
MFAYVISPRTIVYIYNHVIIYVCTGFGQRRFCANRYNYALVNKYMSQRACIYLRDHVVYAS